MSMQISDIRFGDIDARNEILSRDATKRRLFLDSFTIPDEAQIDEVISGEKFLVVGSKGSGKTAYLRYIHQKLEDTTSSLSRFIIFRDEVTKQDREKIATLANFRLYDSVVSNSEEHKLADCASAWQLFIHRELASILSRNQDFCAITNDVRNYINLLDKFFSNFKTSNFKKLLKKISKGRVKIGTLGNELEVEAEFTDIHGNLDVSEFLRYCNEVVSKLDFNTENTDPRINIFFDEINISFVSGEAFKIDAVLIRDLVAACGIMNLLFSEHHLPIYIYTAIRREVIDSVESSVREIRKWVDDKAIHLNWYQNGVEYQSLPIIKLLKARLAANEKSANPKFSDEIELSNYFEAKINKRPIADYLIFESWARPRDLVRLLGSAAKYVPKDGLFSDECFLKARSEYSKGSWEEKRDELNSKYSQADIENIKRILTGFKAKFSKNQFVLRINNLSNNDSRIKKFSKDRVLDLILEDLYKVGVLGNMIKPAGGRPFPSFEYTGLSNFSPELVMCVHRSLWRELSLEAQPRTAFGNQLANSGRKRPFHKRK